MTPLIAHLAGKAGDRPNLPATLTAVRECGAIPGNLTMKCCVPKALPQGAALMVMLHGCTKDASDYSVVPVL